MSKISSIKQKYHFFLYNLTPFRFSLIVTHSIKRILSLFGIKKGFRIIDLAITYGCNLNCRHCSAMVMSQTDRKILTLDDYREIVSQAKELDVLSWNITGGEPLLVPWLDDLITILEPSMHYISIQTNCMLLTKDRAKQLKQLGVNCITTSLDSIDSEEHNAFRGNPESYLRVFEGIKNAKSAGMQVLVAGTITHQNLRSEKLRKLITSVNELGIIFLYNLAVPCGNWKENSEILLRTDDRKYLLELMEKYPMTATDHEAGRNAIGCPAGKEKMYITPYGDVIPCPFIHISFGNVKNTALMDIVKKMQKIPYFAQYQKICTAAEDTDFIENVLKRIYNENEAFPVPAEIIFKELSNSHESRNNL